MNRYAQIALDQHHRHRPLEHSLIDDPTRFFTEIGEGIQADVTNLQDELLGSLRPHESIEDYRHRSYQALVTAEELVLADHDLLRPEADETDDLGDDPILDRRYRDLAEINETIHAVR
jgi:hypothetical protein